MNSQHNNSAEASQTWEKIDSWMCVLPPSRPAAHQLSFVRRWLDKCQRAAPVGVLGSTPELVDLLIDLGFQQITVFEKFPTAYQRMSTFRVHRPLENLVWGDWLETLPRSQGRFCALLSDLTSGNIPYANRPEFCNAVRSTLADGGFFIDRILTGRCPPFNHETHVETFSSEPINLVTANRFNCEIFFSSTLADPDGLIDTTAFYDELHQRCTSPRLRKLLELVEKVTPKGCVWWYGKPWADLAPSYFSNYDLLETVPEPESSWYFEAARMHLLQRRH